MNTFEALVLQDTQDRSLNLFLKEEIKADYMDVMDDGVLLFANMGEDEPIRELVCAFNPACWKQASLPHKNDNKEHWFFEISDNTETQHKHYVIADCFRVTNKNVLMFFKGGKCTDIYNSSEWRRTIREDKVPLKKE